MDEFVYILIHKRLKKEHIICFQKTKEQARRMLQKLVDEETVLLSSDGVEIYNSGKADQNSISLFKTESGFMGQGLSLKSTFSIYKISDKPQSDISEIETLP